MPGSRVAEPRVGSRAAPARSGPWPLPAEHCLPRAAETSDSSAHFEMVRPVYSPQGTQGRWRCYRLFVPSSCSSFQRTCTVSISLYLNLYRDRKPAFPAQLFLCWLSDLACLIFTFEMRQGVKTVCIL